jgi:RNA polymerase sigma-70 factor (ECF subfamily)
VPNDDASAVRDEVDRIYRSDSRRVLATFIRLLGDFDVAEEAMQEAFSAAVERWPQDGVPANPSAWLVSTARFKAIDRMRRAARFDASRHAIAERLAQQLTASDSTGEQEEGVEDDRLRLVFTCCHPALSLDAQVALTLREVCGLTTEEIARAYFTTPSAIAQRIVRAKAKIRDARIPYQIPARRELPARLDAVLQVVYLVFNEGYSPSSGDAVTRAALSAEAIRLGRLLAELLEESEVIGLLSLMLLHESRRVARSTRSGEIVLLADQDRTQWDQALIAEGQELAQRALATRRIGGFTLQAAISAVHSEARVASETDWAQIVGLYDVLLRADNSPVIALNRAVAVAMRDGAAAGVALIEELLVGGELDDYHLAHSARAELLRRLGRFDEARRDFERALQLAKQEPERRLLRRRLEEVGSEGDGREGVKSR